MTRNISKQSKQNLRNRYERNSYTKASNEKNIDRRVEIKSYIWDCI